MAWLEDPSGGALPSDRVPPGVGPEGPEGSEGANEPGDEASGAAFIGEGLWPADWAAAPSRTAQVRTELRVAVRAHRDRGAPAEVTRLLRSVSDGVIAVARWVGGWRLPELSMGWELSAAAPSLLGSEVRRVGDRLGLRVTVADDRLLPVVLREAGADVAVLYPSDPGDHAAIAAFPVFEGAPEITVVLAAPAGPQRFVVILLPPDADVGALSEDGWAALRDGVELAHYRAAAVTVDVVP